MRIILAKNAGFCFGVERAVNIALDASKKNNKVFTYGKLIHNNGYLKTLQKKNIIAVDDLSSIDKSKPLILRSHGVPKATIKYLNDNNIKYIDATCRFVKRIHEIVEREYSQGKKIIIIGNPNHPEVIGINGWCENSAQIICDINDEIKFDNESEYVVVEQTTFSEEKYNIIRNYINNNINFVVFFDTICYTTKQRQSEIIDIAKQSDAVLVIGDKESSNTNKLYEISLKECPKTYFVDSIESLKNINKKKIKTLGITAGASTPKELIQEVIVIMSGKSQVENGASEKNTSNGKAASIMDMAVANMPNTSKKYVPKVGKVLSVRVHTINDNNYMVVGAKGTVEAYLPFEEVSSNPEECNGNTLKKDVDYKVEFIDITTTPWIVSKKKVEEREEKYEKLYEAIEEDKEFEVVIDKVAPNNVGLLANYNGIAEVFIPSSHIELRPIKKTEEKLAKYIGKKFKVLYLPNKVKEDAKDQKTENVETSAEQVDSAVQNETQSTVEKKKPQKIDIRNIKASRKLYMQREIDKKEEMFWSHIHLGDIVIGKTLRFQDFGAFVKVLGKDCLARISDLAWYRINSPADVLELNKEYQFVVTLLDRENNKVNLGYKQLQQKPFDAALEKYEIGSVVKGKVDKILPFGMFVSIGDGIEGLVPIKEVAHEFIVDLNNYSIKEGDEVTIKIIEIDYERKKFTFSIKDLIDPPAAQNNQEEVSNELSDVPSKKIDYDKFATVSKSPAKKSAKSKKESNADDSKNWSDSSSQTTATIGDLFNLTELNMSEEENK